MNHQQEFCRMLYFLSGHCHKAELYTKTQVHTADTDTGKGIPIYFILSSEIMENISVIKVQSNLLM